MLAVVAAVWMIAYKAAKALPEANSVGAMRVIGLAFGTQHLYQPF